MISHGGLAARPAGVASSPQTGRRLSTVSAMVDEAGTGPLPFEDGPHSCGCGWPDFEGGCPECRREDAATEAGRLAFVVVADPVAMPRPRVAVRGGRPHGYIPAHAARAMWEIRQAALGALGDQEPLVGPLAVTVTAWLRMPASIPKRDRLTAMPTRRPDADHFAQTALDGCSPLWADDAQVVDLTVRKRYAVTGSPRWEITVEALP